MKNTIKKISTSMMLLIFAMTNSITASSAVVNPGNLLAFSSSEGYSADKPILRGSAPSVLNLKGEVNITKKDIPISLSLRDSDVKQVLRMFADKAGLNIIFKGDIDGKVTMDLVNIPLNSAFDMVLETSDLSYVVDDNTLIITKNDDTTSISKQAMTVLPVKYINAKAIADFLNKNIYGMKKPGFSSQNIATTNPATNELLIFGSKNDVKIAQKVIDQFDKKPVTTIFKVNHTTPAEMSTMICELLLPNAGAKGDSTGGAAGIMTGAAADGGGGGDIVLGEGKVACSVGAAGEGGDGDITPMGLGGLSVAYYTQLGTVNIVGGSEQQVDMIREFIEQNDKRQPQAYLEFSIIELSEDGSRNFNNEWSFTSKHFSISSDAQGNTKFEPIYVKGPTQHYTDGSPSLVYTINYLLQNGKARTISNPRILVTNGQESTIDMTADYVKTVTSQVVQGSINATTQRDYEIGEDDGIKITVTPFISPDGYVYLNLTPDYAIIKEQISTLSTDEEAAKQGIMDIQATLLQRRNLELKNVRIKDGDTLVIAGMMREFESKKTNKVPFLGDIPGLGSFFRSTTSTKTKSELVILITPKILTETNDNTVNRDAL